MAQSDTAHDRNLLSATVKAEILNNDDSTLDNNFSGKAIDFQFSIQPKVEQSEIKDEVEELEFVGEVIEFSENELSGLEESQEPNYGTTKESYWCEQCNAESCYKKHDLHADFIRITTKPLNQSNPYECATCSIKLLNPTIALFHLSLHDKDSRCHHVIHSITLFRCESILARILIPVINPKWLTEKKLQVFAYAE
uniref:Uncharacterized protein LOC114326938 n=1 Tax=Diabrotica virgifera virgifera TaxID=50390 RepID=A0A6P7FCQ8_DIAVI